MGQFEPMVEAILIGLELFLLIAVIVIIFKRRYNNEPVIEMQEDEVECQENDLEWEDDLSYLNTNLPYIVDDSLDYSGLGFFSVLYNRHSQIKQK